MDKEHRQMILALPEDDLVVRLLQNKSNLNRMSLRFVVSIPYPKLSEMDMVMEEKLNNIMN